MSVPMMRFPDFIGNWVLHDLKSQIDFLAGYAFDSKLMKSAVSKYQLIKMSNVYQSELNLDRNPSYWEDIDKSTKKFLLKKGDVILTLTGTVGKKDYGYSVDILEDSKFLLNQRLVRLRGRVDKSSSKFIKHLISTQRFFYHFFAESKGGTGNQSNVSIEDLKLFQIYFPHLEEQTKIANFLTAVDEKIQHLTQKADLLAQYKKGVMQQIFSQELRFKDDDGGDFPEWERRLLGQLYNITSSKRVFQNEWTKVGVPFYRAREVVKLSENGVVENELFISDEMYCEYKEKYGVPKKDDLIVTGVGTIGRLYVVKAEDKFYFKDGNIIWFKNMGIANSQFVKQLFKSHVVKKQIEDNASITTVGTYTIESANKTSIPFPCVKEQTKIANFLTAIDDKITHAQTQFAAVKQYKQGLLQQMFV